MRRLMAEHTFFHCERWRLEIRNLEAKVSACTIENFCDINLSNEENWNPKARYTDFLKFNVTNWRTNACDPGGSNFIVLFNPKSTK